MDTTNKLLCTVVKHFSALHTASTLAQQLQMSRWGVWKIIKQLEQNQLIRLASAGTGKTSTQTITLNWNNALTEKTVALALALEAEKYKRWKFTFAELEKTADFVLLFGSILHSPQTAGDIDIVAVVQERNLLKLSKILYSIQQTQEKKIHAHNLTAREWKQELQKPNKIFLDALRRGVVLFGQERFVQFMKRLS